MHYGGTGNLLCTPVPTATILYASEEDHDLMMRGSLFLLGAAAGVAVSLVTTRPQLFWESEGRQAATAGPYHQLGLLRDVFERVRADYVESPDDGKLIE